MKKVYRLLVFVLCMVILLSFSVSASAKYSYYGIDTFHTGALLWKKYYVAKIYRDPDWLVVFSGNEKVSTGFEYKGNGELILSQTRSFSLGKQTISSLNSNFKASEFGVEAGFGGSVSKTTSKTWTVSNTSTRTISSSAPKGYYSYNVCLNLYKFKIERYYQGNCDKTVEFFAPKDEEPYRAIVYNKNSASYSGVSLY